MRLIAPDRWGIGLSDPWPRARLIDWPNVVGELAGRLEIERFAVFGASGDGPYALACAWGLPERVTAGVLAIMGVGARRWPGPMVMLGHRSLLECDRGVLALRRLREVAACDLRAAFTWIDGPAADLQRILGPWNFDLCEITVPVLLWQGEQDTIVPPDTCRFLAGAIPDATIEWLPDEGHYAMIPHAEAVFTALSAVG